MTVVPFKEETPADIAHSIEVDLNGFIMRFGHKPFSILLGPREFMKVLEFLNEVGKQDICNDVMHQNKSFTMLGLPVFPMTRPGVSFGIDVHTVVNLLNPGGGAA